MPTRGDTRVVTATQYSFLTFSVVKIRELPRTKLDVESSCEKN